MESYVRSRMFLAFCVLLSSVPFAFAVEDRDAIVRKAKEEKLLIFYNAADFRDGTALVHAFQKKYPFIEPRLFRLGSTQLVVRVLQ